MVLFIVGIITGVAMLNLAGDPAQDAVRTEGRRLEALIRYHQEAAILRLEERGLQLSATEYRWLVREDGIWLPALDGATIMEKTLPGGLTMSLVVEEFPTALTASAAAEQSEQFGQSPEDDALPQLWLSSSGEMLPFEIVIRDPQDRHRYVIRGEADGLLESVIESEAE